MSDGRPRAYAPEEYGLAANPAALPFRNGQLKPFSAQLDCKRAHRRGLGGHNNENLVRAREELPDELTLPSGPGASKAWGAPLISQKDRPATTTVEGPGRACSIAETASVVHLTPRPPSDRAERYNPR